MTQTCRRTWTALIIAAATAACTIYYVATQVLKLTYADRSLIRMGLFVGLPLLAWLIESGFRPNQLLDKLRTLFVTQRKMLKRRLWIIAGGLALVLLVNLLAEPVSHLFGVTHILEGLRMRTREKPFQIFKLLVYIPIINAFGEELFFRAFCYLTICRIGFPRLAACFSAGLFALYHLAIFQSWFSLPLMIASLTGLFGAGLLLNSAARRDGQIIDAWLMHGFFNYAALTILVR